MTATDWFRRTTWTDADQREFFARLAKARSASRPQYLRIQAVHLAESENREHLRSAISLLDRLLTGYPDTLHRAPAHHARGNCLRRLGQTDAALEAFRAAMDAERHVPGVHTDAYLDLGMLIVSAGRTELFPEALGALEEFGGAELFPTQRFRAAAVRACVLHKLTDYGPAREAALQALAAAAEVDSGLRYHRRLGLVRNPDRALISRLAQIAR